MKKLTFIGLLLVFVITGCSLSRGEKKTVLTPDEAKIKAESFINNNLLPSNLKASVSNAVLEGDVYKITLDVSGTTYDSYMTADGKMFFQSGVNMEEAAKQKQTQNSNTETKATAAQKSDKPVVELFVMSYCPYGTQIEKGIIPAVEALGDKIDFTVKFCNYAMHEKQEIDENTTQYCIQKEENGKYFEYMKCFLKEGKSQECLASTKIDTGKIKSCVSATDKEFNLTKNYNDKSAWSGNFPPYDIYKADNNKYSVQGSPTLVINGSQVQSNRDSASLLKTICSAFNNPPEECNKSLSSTAPSAGFGEGTASSGSGGSCN